MIVTTSVLARRRRLPLALGVASAFALSLPIAASATTWVVNSCVDDANSATTPGTLRYAVAHALNPSLLQLPDTVDLSGLTGANACPGGKLTLSQGFLSVSQRSLIFTGPGAATLAIAGSGPCGTCDSRVVTHTGTGVVSINNLGLSDGNVYHTGLPSVGGCVLSQGTVALNHAEVSGCSTTTQSSTYRAYGGAVYAAKNLIMTYSTISGGALAGSGTAQGGGAYVKGDVSLDHSTISGNAVKGFNNASGGGLFVIGALDLVESTVSGNSLSASSQADGHAYGGGVYAKGSVTLTTSSIESNSASGYYGATGGGIVGLADVSLGNSLIAANSATALAANSAARGGGATAAGDFSAKDSTIDGNQVSAGPGTANALGGGLATYKNLSLVRSTVSRNHSTGSAGGILGAGPNSATSSAYLQSSTISGNTSANLVGGALFTMGTVGVYNTTIAFNTGTIGRLGAAPPYDYYAPGLALSGASVAMTATLQSSMLSNNTYGPTPTEFDLSTAKTAAHSITFNSSPARNFIRSSIVDGKLPDDTLPDPQKITCPLLGPLRDNGGPTQTHALLSTSPAIDQGYNSVLQLTEDQRGDGYARESNGIADIGAYEVDQADVVFNMSFEGCP